MRRVVTLAFVIGLLLIGGYLTTLAARQGTLVRPNDVLPPEASVFIVTPEKKAALLVIVAVLGMVVVGMGLTLGLLVWLVDRGYHKVMVGETEQAE